MENSPAVKDSHGSLCSHCLLFPASLHQLLCGTQMLALFYVQYKGGCVSLLYQLYVFLGVVLLSLIGAN